MLLKLFRNTGIVFTPKCQGEVKLDNAGKVPHIEQICNKLLVLVLFIF